MTRHNTVQPLFHQDFPTSRSSCMGLILTSETTPAQREQAHHLEPRKHPKKHSRLRGENGHAAMHGFSINGTPPPTRREQDPQPPPRSSGGKHPRLRGENVAHLQHADLTTGTPPPTRGKSARGQAAAAGQGDTPAYAGKTTGRTQTGTSAREHPRLHGENCPAQARTVSTTGTPPPTQGKHVDAHPCRSETGNTPAYARATLPGLHRKQRSPYIPFTLHPHTASYPIQSMFSMHDPFAQKAASASAEAGKRSSKTKMIQHRILPKKRAIQPRRQVATPPTDLSDQECPVL